jgi:integrase
MNPELAVYSPEEEFDKDQWDVRRIPGARMSIHTGRYWLKFDSIPLPFRSVVKQYLRLLITRYTHDHCRRQLAFLVTFFTFLMDVHPTWTTLRDLSRADAEHYLVMLKTHPSAKRPKRKDIQVYFAYYAFRQFLEYLERSEAPEAPRQLVRKLVWPEDVAPSTTYYTYTPDNSGIIKYIPENVLAQLDTHLHHLSPYTFPVVFVLRVSGWRIADVLNLRYDQCLEETSNGWWLCGDITKTRIRHHRVPISKEVASFIQTQQTLAQNQHSSQENPEHYLFPSPSPRRRGLPVAYCTVQHALNRLAYQYEIRDDQGAIFHFKTHAFRHTKAVELINNGMSLVLVQQWLAHVSPEMTLVYAKILDPTMRKAWEQAFAQGAVRLDAQGAPRFLARDQMGDDQTIEWEYLRHHLDAVRLPNGYCFKPKKADCPIQVTPCYTCHHFCTTPDFLPQMEHEEREMRELISLGERAGSVPWVERNTQKLGKLLPVLQVLREGHIHHPAGKTVREYTLEERSKRHGT